jgi:hypothetical protein
MLSVLVRVHRKGTGPSSQAWGGGDLVIPVPEASLAVCLRLWNVEDFILAGY